MVKLFAALSLSLLSLHAVLTIAAPSFESEIAQRDFDDGELMMVGRDAMDSMSFNMYERALLMDDEARSLENEVDERAIPEFAELSERSKIGNKIKGFFKKAFNTVKGFVGLKREIEDFEERDFEKRDFEELSERSKIGNKIKGFFKKAFNTVKGFVGLKREIVGLKREMPFELSTRELEQRSKIGNKIKGFFKKAFNTVKGFVGLKRDTENEDILARDVDERDLQEFEERDFEDFEERDFEDVEERDYEDFEERDFEDVEERDFEELAERSKIGNKIKGFFKKAFNTVKGFVGL